MWDARPNAPGQAPGRPRSDVRPFSRAMARKIRMEDLGFAGPAVAMARLPKFDNEYLNQMPERRGEPPGFLAFFRASIHCVLGYPIIRRLARGVSPLPPDRRKGPSEWATKQSTLARKLGFLPR